MASKYFKKHLKRINVSLKKMNRKKNNKVENMELFFEPIDTIIKTRLIDAF